jgi:Ion channel
MAMDDGISPRRTMPAAPLPLSERRGLPLRQRARMPDSYGLLLGLVLASILSTGLAGDRTWARVIPIGIQGGMLLFAQRTSGASRKLVLPTTLFIGAALLATIVASASGTARTGSGAFALVGSLLVAATAIVIVRRLLEHTSVSGATILGAVCIYLLVGLFFSYVYGAIGAFGNGFFQGHPDPAPSDFLYFSYVTLSTVGYGDFVAGTRLGQMTAVCEALMGQVYLVTVVALLVGRASFRRRPEDAPLGHLHGDHPGE